jgi:hypothetical protein
VNNDEATKRKTAHSRRTAIIIPVDLVARKNRSLLFDPSNAIQATETQNCRRLRVIRVVGQTVDELTRTTDAEANEGGATPDGTEGDRPPANEIVKTAS